MIEADWKRRWESRNKLTCRATEKSIKNWIAKYKALYEQDIYYDWHPKDGFVAYTKEEKDAC